MLSADRIGLLLYKGLLRGLPFATWVAAIKMASFSQVPNRYFAFKGANKKGFEGNSTEKHP